MKPVLDAFVSRAFTFCSLVYMVLFPLEKRERTLGTRLWHALQGRSLYVVSENFHIWEFIRILGAVKSKTLLRFSDFHAFHVVTARIMPGIEVTVRKECAGPRKARLQSLDVVTKCLFLQKMVAEKVFRWIEVRENHSTSWMLSLQR